LRILYFGGALGGVGGGACGGVPGTDTVVVETSTHGKPESGGGQTRPAIAGAVIASSNAA
jgi:hypothetical protein